MNLVDTKTTSFKKDPKSVPSPPYSLLHKSCKLSSSQDLVVGLVPSFRFSYFILYLIVKAHSQCLRFLHQNEGF